MIINSLCDTDFYKLTMLQAVLHQSPGVLVRYKFKWRNFNDMQLRISMEDFVGRVKKEIDHLCTLRFEEEELKFLEDIPYFKRDFIEYLRLLQLNRSYIQCRYDADNNINIVVEGPWANTILFEVPVLAIISQLYTENTTQNKTAWIIEARKRLDDKFSILESNIQKDESFLFADFGTRRRADVGWHEELLVNIKENHGRFISGTSNVFFAMKHGFKPVGTMAHEYLQAYQQLGSRLYDFQKMALQKWADEYRGDLGIALSDVVGFRAFMKDFDKYFAKLFDGCRHDSGDPVWWVENLIEHYKRFNIDPKTKHAIFSDGLNFETAINLFRHFNTKINVGFGIGTYLTNDCGFTAPQIVMKMVECNGQPVAKISDSTGKSMCEDDAFQNYLSKVIQEKLER